MTKGTSHDKIRKPSDKEPNPILVGGENRSGTTLLGITLDSHPDVVMGSEIDFISPSFEKIRNNELGEPEERFLRQLGRFGVRNDEILTLLSEATDDLGRVPLTHSERSMLMQQVGNHRAAVGNVERWGFQIQRQIGNAELLSLSLPNAKFVHVVRDGRDVAASHMKLSNKTWTYKSAEEAAKGWASLVRGVREIAHPTITEIRYEDLIHNPAPTLKTLLGGLALAWSDNVMEHSTIKHDLLDSPADHPSANQVNRPLYSDSIGAYRHTLSKDEINTFERIAGEELELFGYK
jgi:hypothetical protein